MKRLLFASAALVLTVGAAFAQFQGGGSVDPFATFHCTPARDPAVNRNTAATSLRTTQSLNPAVRNLVMIWAGQSNMQDIAPSLYTPANPTKIDNLNICDGGVYAAVDPLVGTQAGTDGNGQFGNLGLKLADDLIAANLFDRIVIVPIAEGGTAVNEWATDPVNTDIPVTLARLKARGMVPGTNVTVIIAWGQGETDTMIGTSQASYTASMNSIISQASAAGFTGTWFVAQESWISGAGSASVTAAQAAVVSHPGVWAGPNIDALVGSICGAGANLACRFDGTHLSDAGQVTAATAWKAALHLFGAPF